MPQGNKQLSAASGFSLIETVVAIAILLIVVSGIMNLIFQGTTSSQLQQERTTATYLAAEAIEFIRADRDTYWLENIGSNTFDDWLNTGSINACQASGSCRVDARPGSESINPCSGNCPVLKYNVNTKRYGYQSGLDWRDSRYVRIVEIEAIDHDDDNDDDEAMIIVTVSWERSGGETSSITLRNSLTSYWR